MRTPGEPVAAQPETAYKTLPIDPRQHSRATPGRDGWGALVAYEFGAHASPGPLVPANVVAAALSAADAHTDVLGGLLDGSALGTWAFSEPGKSLDPSDFEIRADGNELVLSGVKRPVE